MPDQGSEPAVRLHAITAANRDSWNRIAPARDGEPASWGAICWAPDLDVLAGILTSRLSPHGSVLICDHHPLWEVLAVRGENHLAVTGDYFGGGRPRHPDDARLPTGARGEDEGTRFAAFVWPVSDVVMSLVRAGLRLDAFFEAAEPAIYPGLGDRARHLPAYYVIKASRADRRVG